MGATRPTLLTARIEVTAIAMMRRMEAGPKGGRLAARERGLKEGPTEGPSWPAGLQAGGDGSIWKTSFTLTNQCLKAKQTHSEHSRGFFFPFQV